MEGEPGLKPWPPPRGRARRVAPRGAATWEGAYLRNPENPPPARGGVDLREIQRRIDARYGALDRRSGAAFLVLVLQEEVGELAEAVRKGDGVEAGKEAADVLFAALAVANIVGADAEALLTAKFLDRAGAEVTKSWTDVPGGAP